MTSQKKFKSLIWCPCHHDAPGVNKRYIFQLFTVQMDVNNIASDHSHKNRHHHIKTIHPRVWSFRIVSLRIDLNSRWETTSNRNIMDIHTKCNHEYSRFASFVPLHKVFCCTIRSIHLVAFLSRSISIYSSCYFIYQLSTEICHSILCLLWRQLCIKSFVFSQIPFVL